MKKIISITVFVITAAASFGMSDPRMRMVDKIRIREAISISQKFGDSIWEGISQVPFAIILVTDSVEFLVYHTNPPVDFKLSEKDTVLRADIFFRKRQYSKNWLATFPVNGINCIVAGIPENTGRGSTEWIITLLHEHFHQYEYSQPGYYADVEKLELSGGDQTGMWMLNYPFPYGEKTIIGLYDKYVSALAEAAGNIDSKGFEKKFNKYKTSRKKFSKRLLTADYRYFSFQIWQEGIARYTEYKFLEKLAGYIPSSEIVQLKDFISFAECKRRFLELQFSELAKLELSKAQRVCFYAIGFAEGILLDKINPGWRAGFFTNKFYLEKMQ